MAHMSDQVRRRGTTAAPSLSRQLRRRKPERSPLQDKLTPSDVTSLCDAAAWRRAGPSTRRLCLAWRGRGFFAEVGTFGLRVYDGAMLPVCRRWDWP